MNLAGVQQQPTFEDMELLVEVTRLLTLHDVPSVMQRVIDLMARAVGAQKSSLFLLEDSAVDWSHVFTARTLRADQERVVVARVLDQGLAGWVVRHGEGALVNDTAADARWHVFPDDELVVRAALCVPLMLHGRVEAVLTLSHPQPGHFTEHHLRLLTIVANQAVLALHSAQLVTRLRQQQEQTDAALADVRRQQQQMAIVLNNVPDVLFVLDEEARVILLNAGALAFLDHDDTGAVVGKPLLEFVESSSVLVRIADAVSAPFEKDGFWAFEARSERRRRDYQVTITVWENTAEQRCGFVVLMSDVTKLRGLSRFKDDTIKLVSHDLRAPLSLISGYNDMVEMDLQALDPNSPMLDYVDVIRRSIKRMNSLLDDMMHAKTANTDVLSLQSNVDMRDLVEQAVANTRPQAVYKHQTLLAAVDLPEGVRGTVDRFMIRQAMENYISNAIKYTAEGGHIEVRARLDGHVFHYEVIDDGIGIPREHLPRVFQPYYRVRQPGTEGAQGAGLGLNMVKSIVERHRGEVWVQSELGVGSHFGLWIPLHHNRQS